jgi:hypothetical protein
MNGIGQTEREKDVLFKPINGLLRSENGASVCECVFHLLGRLILFSSPRERLENFRFNDTQQS